MSNPDQPFSVASDLSKLGERLRLAREARGVSAEVASEQASVPIRYLRMFEEGRYPVVADPAYLTHFVRRYASYLGLDAWQASRDFIAETEPETALRRAGKLTAEPAKEPSMTISRQNSPLDKGNKDKGRGGSGGGSPPPAAAAKRFKFDAGPISLVGAAVTLGLFLFNLWVQRHPQGPAITESEPPAASSPAAPASAPAPPSAPEASAPAPAPAPAAAESAPQAPAAAPAPEPAVAAAPSSESAPPPSAPAASTAPSAQRAAPEPLPAAPAADVQATRREPAASAPPAAAPRNAVSPPAATQQSVAQAGGEPHRKSRIDATNKASEALRAEQVERMKARAAGGDGAPAAGGGAAAPGNAPPAPGQ